MWSGTVILKWSETDTVFIASKLYNYKCLGVFLCAEYIHQSGPKRTKILAILGCHVDEKIFFLRESGLPQCWYRFKSIFRKMYRLIFCMKVFCCFSPKCPPVYDR